MGAAISVSQGGGHSFEHVCIDDKIKHLAGVMVCVNQDARGGVSGPHPGCSCECLGVRDRSREGVDSEGWAGEEGRCCDPSPSECASLGDQWRLGTREGD